MEKRIRFGCGFLFGMFLLGVGLLRFTMESWPDIPLWYYFATGLGSVVIGLLGVRWGDELYVKIGRFFGGW